MTDILMGSGIQVTPCEAAPVDFDPLTATESQLHHYGYPPRPADRKSAGDLRSGRESYRRWEELCSLLREATPIAPSFRVNERTRRPQPPGKSATISHNWSGCRVAAEADHKFTHIGGEWTVPRPGNPTPKAPAEGKRHI
jgi:hypothetical protein